MRLLLDTHVFLWFIAGDSRLEQTHRALIEHPDYQRYVSIATLWEIAIKASLGRLIVPLPITRLIREQVWANGFDLLALTPDHLDALYGLPYHHKDPFDRLLIAQAQADERQLLTQDHLFQAYGI